MSKENSIGHVPQIIPWVDLQPSSPEIIGRGESTIEGLSTFAAKRLKGALNITSMYPDLPPPTAHSIGNGYEIAPKDIQRLQSYRPRALRYRLGTSLGIIEATSNNPAAGKSAMLTSIDISVEDIKVDAN